MITAFQRRHRQLNGFTVVELLVGMAIVSLVVVGALFLYIGLKNAFQKERGQVEEIITQAQHGLNQLERDLREAGFGVWADETIAKRQLKVIYGGPYEIIFNADLDADKAQTQGEAVRGPINPSIALGSTVPFNAPGGLILYPPRLPNNSNIKFPLAYADVYNEKIPEPDDFGMLGAETVRYTLDVNQDGIIDTEDREINFWSGRQRDIQNPSLYILAREIYGYDGRNNVPGVFQPDIIATNIRGWTDETDNYLQNPLPVAPDGQTYHQIYRPQPIFLYWGHFYDPQSLPLPRAFDPDKPQLWGDTNNDGRLDESELDAWIKAAETYAGRPNEYIESLRVFTRPEIPNVDTNSDSVIDEKDWTADFDYNGDGRPSFTLDDVLVRIDVILTAETNEKKVKPVFRQRWGGAFSEEHNMYATNYDEVSLNTSVRLVNVIGTGQGRVAPPEDTPVNILPTPTKTPTQTFSPTPDASGSPTETPTKTPTHSPTPSTTPDLTAADRCALSIHYNHVGGAQVFDEGPRVFGSGSKYVYFELERLGAANVLIDNFYLYWLDSLSKSTSYDINTWDNDSKPTLIDAKYLPVQAVLDLNLGFTLALDLNFTAPGSSGTKVQGVPELPNALGLGGRIGIYLEFDKPVTSTVFVLWVNLRCGVGPLHVETPMFITRGRNGILCESFILPVDVPMNGRTLPGLPPSDPDLNVSLSPPLDIVPKDVLFANESFNFFLWVRDEIDFGNSSSASRQNVNLCTNSNAGFLNVTTEEFEDSGVFTISPNTHGGLAEDRWIYTDGSHADQNRSLDVSAATNEKVRINYWRDSVGNSTPTPIPDSCHQADLLGECCRPHSISTEFASWADMEVQDCSVIPAVVGNLEVCGGGNDQVKLVLENRLSYEIILDSVVVAFSKSPGLTNCEDSWAYRNRGVKPVLGSFYTIPGRSTCGTTGVVNFLTSPRAYGPFGIEVSGLASLAPSSYYISVPGGGGEMMFTLFFAPPPAVTSADMTCTDFQLEVRYKESGVSGAPIEKCYLTYPGQQPPPRPTKTPTPTLSPTATLTTPSATPTVTPSGFPTHTPSSTPTFSPIPTSTPSGAPTFTPSLTPSPTPPPLPTDTPTRTPTLTPSPSPTILPPALTPCIDDDFTYADDADFQRVWTADTSSDWSLNTAGNYLEGRTYAAGSNIYSGFPDAMDYNISVLFRPGVATVGNLFQVGVILRAVDQYNFASVEIRKLSAGWDVALITKLAAFNRGADTVQAATLISNPSFDPLATHQLVAGVYQNRVYAFLDGIQMIDYVITDGTLVANGLWGLRVRTAASEFYSFKVKCSVLEQTPTPTLTPTPTQTPTGATSPTPTLTPSPTQVPTATPTPTLTPTNTPVPACLPLYDFESPFNDSGWGPNDPSKWKLVSYPDPSNIVYEGTHSGSTGRSYSLVGPDQWQDYIVKVELPVLDFPDPPTEWKVGVVIRAKNQKLYLVELFHGGGSTPFWAFRYGQVDLVSGTFAIDTNGIKFLSATTVQRGGSYTLVVDVINEVINTELRDAIDGSLLEQNTFTSDFLSSMSSGSVGLVVTDSMARFDNFQAFCRDSSPAATPTYTPLPTQTPVPSSTPTFTPTPPVPTSTPTNTSPPTSTPTPTNTPTPTPTNPPVCLGPEDFTLGAANWQADNPTLWSLIPEVGANIVYQGDTSTSPTTRSISWMSVNPPDQNIVVETDFKIVQQKAGATYGPAVIFRRLNNSNYYMAMLQYNENTQSWSLIVGQWSAFIFVPEASVVAGIPPSMSLPSPWYRMRIEVSRRKIEAQIFQGLTPITAELEIIGANIAANGSVGVRVASCKAWFDNFSVYCPPQ